MAHAKNYENAFTFVKVIQRKLLAPFFLDTVYKVINVNCDVRRRSKLKTGTSAPTPVL